MLSCAQICGHMDASHQASLSFTVSQRLLKLTSIELMDPTISSSVAPFSFCFQFFPASESFPVSRVFASSGQSIGALALASILLRNIQGWFPLWLTGWISLQFKRLSRVFSRTTVQNASICCYSAFFIFQLSHPYRTTGKILALTIRTFVGKVMPLLFNMLSRFSHSFSFKEQASLILWLVIHPQ